MFFHSSTALAAAQHLLNHLNDKKVPAQRFRRARCAIHILTQQGTKRKASTMFRRSLVPALFALSLLVGCKHEVTDTERRTFAYVCDKEDCTVSPTSEDRSDAVVKDSFVLHKDTRVLSVCPATAPAFECRPLTCESGGVCSQLGGTTFRCDKGICQDPTRDISFEDRLALCLAKTGIWQPSPSQVERLTLARACLPPCEMPTDCMQP